MANKFEVANWVTLESLDILKNELCIARMMNTDQNKEFQQAFPIGETLRVKLPQRFTVADGPTFQPQGIDRKSTTVTMSEAPQISFELPTADLALHIERGREAFRREYIEPAMRQMAQEIETRASRFMKNRINNIVGVLGTNATNLDTAGAAEQRMVELACPAGEKAMITSPASMTSIANGITNVFNDQTQVSKAFLKNYVAKARGFDFYRSNSLLSHTAGTWAGAVTVNLAGQYGGTLNVNCTSGDTFREGDVISIANVLAVNPATRQSVGHAKQFRITQDVTATGSTATIFISAGPPVFGIAGPGDQYQNVDSLPANLAALTLFPGTSSPSGKTGINNIAMHRDAFALVGVPLYVPAVGGPVDMASTTRDPDTGLSISFIRQFDPIERRLVNRFDSLFGFGELYTDSCAVRVLSNT